MRIPECSDFLREALPHLGLRWAGFRKVRRLVCKRLAKRAQRLGLPDLASYRAYLQGHAAEWTELEAMCRIPISRFYRDRAVFASLEHDVLPALAAQALADGRAELRCWSACCAAGEEPYTIALLWHLRVGPRFPALALRIVATDIDPKALHRARVGWYSATSVKDVPESLLCAGFEESGGEHTVRAAFRTVEFLEQDIRRTDPGGAFDLILCRNCVLTYLLPAEQERIMDRVIARLRPGGALVVGVRESLPASCTAVAPWSGARAVYRAFPAARLAPPLHCVPPQPQIGAGPQAPSTLPPLIVA
jgi:chemotaxis protein methyltransferase CheR